MIHASIRQFKSNKNRLNGVQSLSEIDTDQIPDVDYINQNIDCEQIISLIQTLEDPYQKVFNLFVIDGYSHEEISEILGININSSRSYLFRARQVLMQMISAQKIESYGK